MLWLLLKKFSSGTFGADLIEKVGHLGWRALVLFAPL